MVIPRRYHACLNCETGSFNPRHTYTRGRPPRRLQELLENAQSQRAQLPTMLLYIQGGPDDFFSGQVRSLTMTSFSSLCTIQNGELVNNNNINNNSSSPQPSVADRRHRHQITRNDEPVRMICNFTCLHDCVYIIACLHA